MSYKIHFYHIISSFGNNSDSLSLTNCIYSHTDFEKHFIKAEVVGYSDFISCEGIAGSKEVGKLRLEGKDYIVKDGDVVHFKTGA